MSNKETNEIENIRNLLSTFLKNIIDYLEFIGTQKPSIHITEVIAKLKILDDNFMSATIPFLTIEQTMAYQNETISLILTWNKEIEKNVVNFYNAHAEVARLATINTPIAHNNALKTLTQNFARYFEATKVLNNTLEKTNLKLLDYFDFYAVFYSQIASTEAIEYVYYEPLKEDLIKFKLNSSYDLDEIFSVTSKWKNRRNVYQTDSKMIRNALAHFYYKFEEINDDTVNIIFYPDNAKLMRKLSYREFFKYMENNKFLFQSFHTIVTLMALFSNLRVYFCTDSDLKDKLNLFDIKHN